MRFRPHPVQEQLIDSLKGRGINVPRYLSDDQLVALERHPEYRASKDVVCVVCGGRGEFRYNGQTYQCEDDAYGHPAMRLARWYWLHNIPLQYQQLVWDEWPQDIQAQIDAKEAVDNYIANYQGFRVNGIGITFHSVGLGTGKTWAATATLKGIAKLGFEGWFVPFGEILSYFKVPNDEERDYLIKKVKESPVLVLDEVQKPWSQASKQLFGDQLEGLIRPRTNANLPTIITTNMTMEQLEEEYPRVFSLLMMKNIQVELKGSDARYGGVVWKRQIETIANGESLPIT